MKQLAAARAVITILTPNSIKSDWVRAEAGAAKKDGKLIPVKTPDVAYGDIPLPFGEMHTENVGSTELIRAAVVAQLEKPAEVPTVVSLLTNMVKYEVLTWVGIVGGAVTLFGNLDTVLKLADWARVLVEHWKEWTHAFWVWAFGWLGIHLPPEWTPVLSFLLFGSFLTVGQALSFFMTSQPIVDKDRLRSFYGQRVSVYFVWMTLFIIAVSSFAFKGPFENRLMFLVVFCIGPAVILVLCTKHKLYAALSMFLFTAFFVIITLNQFPSGFNENSLTVGMTALLLVWLLPPLLFFVAPAKAVARRLIFLALGLLLLIGMNELSKLGLDVTAPKVQG